MGRILAAVAIVVFLIAYADWKKDNPDQPITTRNATSDKIADGMAGNATRANTQARQAIGKINEHRGDQLEELDKF